MNFHYFFRMTAFRCRNEKIFSALWCFQDGKNMLLCNRRNQF
ncbi:hypothetical protein HMPREF3201_02326 [Megasphaera sp. MJR8396C]|nr:hypothetical protein HMPREF3201_02326 [Megasphaera sp. MJR8396C]